MLVEAKILEKGGEVYSLSLQADTKQDKEELAGIFERYSKRMEDTIRTYLGHVKSEL